MMTRQLHDSPGVSPGEASQGEIAQGGIARGQPVSGVLVPGGPCGEDEARSCCPGMGNDEDLDSLDAAIESLRVMGMAYRRFFHTALGDSHPGTDGEEPESRSAQAGRSLSPQEFMVMTHLSARQGFAPSDLARMLAIARPNMAALLKSLRERELINMESSIEDKRRQIVTISPAGQSLVARVMVLHRQHLRMLFSGLDSRELLEMEGMAKRMTSLMGKLEPVPIGRSRAP